MIFLSNIAAATPLILLIACVVVLLVGELKE